MKIAKATMSEAGTCSAFEVFFIFLRLGLTSFGGPVAHIGYFHNEFVTKRQWFDQHTYADLVALCQFLPGPGSSQIGIAIGLSRSGLSGAFAAWLGFTLPSALLLTGFALGVTKYGGILTGGWIHGLKILAVAVVAHALWVMGRKLCPDYKRSSLALAGAIVVSLSPTTMTQVGVILIGGVFGLVFLRDFLELPHSPFRIKSGLLPALVVLTSFGVLLLGLPFLANASGLQGLKLFDSFFRVGSLVFGGGHVVLPLLKAEVVSQSWVSSESFMAGYAAAQAVPGPLFSFAAYLGAVSKLSPNGIAGAVICLVAIFLPSFFLVIGVLPLWERLRRIKQIRYAMLGFNASVVGLLLAAFYQPVWTSAISNVRDFILALGFFLALIFSKTPVWALVLLSALVGEFFIGHHII